MSVHLGNRTDTAAHTVSLEELLRRLLSDHPPTIFVADADGALNKHIAVPALEFDKDFRFGDDEDFVYRLICDEKTTFVSQVLPSERFRHGRRWLQMSYTKYHYVEIIDNKPLGRPGTKLEGPLELQEPVTRIRLRLEKRR